MNTCTYTWITAIYAGSQACRHAGIHILIQPYIHTYIQKRETGRQSETDRNTEDKEPHIHAYVHAHAHAYIRTQKIPYTYDAYRQAYTPIYIY